MKALKYFVITAVLISVLSSCLVGRPGGRGPRHHGHHNHDHGEGNGRN